VARRGRARKNLPGGGSPVCDPTHRIGMKAVFIAAETFCVS